MDLFFGLDLEASNCKKNFDHRRIDTIYIGGGTPTVLSEKELGHLFNIVRDHFLCAEGVEFTVEANPNSISHDKLIVMLKQGVNRLSLGVQSFSDTVLSTLGRIHNAQDARDAFRLAQKAGFGNIGIDLIYGVPGQTLSQWRQSLETAIELKPQHISIYSLSLDEGSQLHQEAATGRFFLPDEEVAATMYELAVKHLVKAGFGRYELSNFSFPGFECRHNLNYWERGEYLGLGPAAWSFISGKRYSNIADVSEYVRKLSCGLSAVDKHEVVDRATAARESILLALRTMKGLDLNRFMHEYGADLLRNLLGNSASFRDAELMRVTEGRLIFTDKGLLLSDAVLARLSI